jgi:hypothetical protein
MSYRASNEVLSRTTWDADCLSTSAAVMTRAQVLTHFDSMFDFSSKLSVAKYMNAVVNDVSENGPNDSSALSPSCRR